MKKRISIILAMGLMLFAMSKIDLHADESVTMISTPQELDNVRKNLKGNYQLANDIDMSNYTDYEPIGNESEGAFKGTFNGNGHTIKNLEMDYDSYKYAGLFGCLDGKVQNVKLENANIKASRYAGGIAGYMDDNGSVSGCTVSGSIEVEGNGNFSTYQGGIIGYANGEILKCENRGNVLGGSGIVDYTKEGIKDCKNYGKVIYGISRYTGKSIENCINCGKISTGSDGYGIGSAEEIINCGNYGDGFFCAIGYGRKEIKNCINTGYTNVDFLEGYVEANNCMDLGVYYGNSPFNLLNVEKNCGNYIQITTNSTFEIHSVTGGTRIELGDIKGLLSDNVKNYIEDLDEDLWEVESGWNSGLPMLKNIPEHLELSELAVTLCRGDSVKLKGRVGKKEITDLKWESGDSSALKVKQDGTVQALANENEMTWVKATTSDGLTMRCTVFLCSKKPTSVYIDGSIENMKIGETRQLKARFNNALAQSNVTWSSSNPEVASIDQNGLVTAKKTGVTKIKVITDNGCEDTTDIYVKYENKLTVDKTLIDMTVGDTDKITVTFTPEGTTDDITYESSNTNVVTVDNKGTLTAKNPGTAMITITTGQGLKEYCSVTVTKKKVKSATISLKDVNATPGEEIEVPVMISDNPGISAMKVSISYDQNILTPVNAEKTSLLGGAVIKGEKQEDGIYNILWYNTKDINENGVIYKVKFKVNENANINSETKLKVTSTAGDVCDAQHNDIELNDATGVINIKEKLYGDVYEDDVLNSHDVLLLQQYLTELAQFTDHQLLLADMTNDNEVNMQDLVVLANKVVSSSSTSRKAKMAKAKVQKAADQQMEISIGEQRVDKDGFVDIPISFKNCTGISAFRFKVNYDETILDLLSITGQTDEINDHLMVNLKDTKDGKSLVTWYNDQNVVLDGNIMTLRFKVNKEKLGNGTEISLLWDEKDICDKDLNTFDITTSNGKVLPEEKGAENPSTGSTIPTQPSTQEPPATTEQIQNTNKQTKVDKISVTAISNNIAAGKKVKLTANISNNATNKSVTWISSNKKIATVDKNGVVKFNKKAAGKSVTITAIANDGSGKKATFKLKAMKGIVKKVTIVGKKSVKAGKILKLKAKVSASKGANKKLKWLSSNTKYAIVSTSGKVKALKAGKGKKVKITAMATDGSGKKKSVTVKIK